MSGDTGSEFAVGVAVSDPEQVEQLLRTAIDVARERDGRVMLINVAVEPASSPFRVFDDEVIKEEFHGESTAVLDRAVATAADADVGVDGRTVIAGSEAAGVVTAAEEYGLEVVLLGWHARRRSDIVMGHVIDEVVAAAPCDVLVEKVGPTANGVERVLVPAGTDEHTELAAEVGTAVARANDATLDVVRVIPPHATAEERDSAAELAASVADSVEGVETSVEVLEGEPVVETLVEAAEARDVTVVGGGAGGLVRRFVVGSTAREVGRRAATTVIVATRGGGVRDRLAHPLRRLRAR